MAAVLAATLVVGAAVQGLVGLGIGLVTAPVVTLLAPELMPALMIWLGFYMTLVTLVREHHEIDWRGLAWAVPARVPGTVVGVLLVGWFSTQALGVAVAVMVLVGVVVTVRALALPTTPGVLVAAGVVSGVTGTATSIGGPPIAIVYQHHPPHQIRSTLAVFFALGTVLSLTGLAIVGELPMDTFLLATALLPAVIAGFLLSRVLNRVVPAHHIRTGVLGVCALSALVLLTRSLSG